MKTALPPAPDLPGAREFLSTIDVAANTRRAYGVALKAFARYLNQRDLQADSLAGFRVWLSERYARRTIGNYLAAATRFVEWLDLGDHLPSGVSSGRMKLVLRGQRGRRRTGYKAQPIKDGVPLIVEYYDALSLPAPKSSRARRGRLTLLRNRAIVHVLFATGLRAHELAGLRLGHLDGVHLHVTGKGDKERLAKLDAEALAAIERYLAARGFGDDGAQPLFVRHDRRDDSAAKSADHAPITTRMVGHVVAQAARSLGLPTRVSPHDFRRYLGTQLLNEGMPLESVQAVLGHESIVTTRTVYAHTLPHVLDEQLDTYRVRASDAARRARKVSS